MIELAIAAGLKFYEIGWFTIVPIMTGLTILVMLGYTQRHKINNRIDWICERLGKRDRRQMARKLSRTEKRKVRLVRQRPLF